MHAEDAIRQNLLISHPPPEYPYEARQKFITGTGVFDFGSTLKALACMSFTLRPALVSLFLMRQ